MTGSAGRARWLVCQLGAREHYAVARALQRRGELDGLVTDAWAPPGSPWTLPPGLSGRRLRERYSRELSVARVDDFTGALIAHELLWKLQRLAGWSLPIARNRWYQKRAATIVANAGQHGVHRRIVFAHSYAALEILRVAKRLGYMTVLGQIDPGEGHVDVLRDAAARWPEYGPPLAEPPAGYFAEWRAECDLADRIIVNSEWSMTRLERAGIDRAKIANIPLPFEAESDAAFTRRYPQAFTDARPLRVLFVGSVAVFKGVPSLLESLDRLTDVPIELSVVGSEAAMIPERFRRDPRIRWVGAVSRSVVMDYYRDSDVLVFPSHSDGFGMAQVEAQGWRLPIVASRSSGRVVEDGVNGLLLGEVSADAIAAALRSLLEPALLTRLSAGRPATLTTLDAFGEALSGLAHRG